jgi:hypothetical protein
MVNFSSMDLPSKIDSREVVEVLDKYHSFSSCISFFLILIVIELQFVFNKSVQYS